MSAVEAEAALPPVQVVKTINAPREEVFAAWTDPIVLAKWFGPPEVSVSEAVLDARVNGRYRIVMRGDSGSVHENYGIYREVAPPERLVFTWFMKRRGSDDVARESLVTVEFRTHNVRATEITLTHELLTNEEARRGVRHGWSTGFEALDALLRKGKNMTTHTIAESKEVWLEARRKLLAEEKEYTRAGDKLAAKRRALPWLPVTKDYTFDTPSGKQSLSDLFAGRSQLIVYQFMFDPSWDEGCKSCSFWSDHFAGAIPHLGARDVTLIAISLAPLAKLQAFAKRMGWKHTWVSSHGNEYNYDFDASFRPEALAEGGDATYNFAPVTGDMSERHGISVFAKDQDGAIFHTYACYARGAETVNTTYRYLDLAPRGRNEDDLPWPMSWLRFHDKYGA